MDKGELIGRGARAEVFALPEGKVLKLYLAGADPAVAINEADVSQKAHDAGAPSPAVYGLVDEDGRKGIIYERISGPTMLDLLVQQPGDAARLGGELGVLHAGIHELSAPGLHHAMPRLRALLNSAPAPAGLAERALAVLATLPDGDRLCHGDFHPLNVIMSPTGPVIIDWDTAALADPHADVARTVLTLKLMPAFVPEAGRQQAAAVVAAFTATYLERYGQLRPLERDRLRAWELPLAVARIGENQPPEADMLMALIDEHMKTH